MKDVDEHIEAAHFLPETIHLLHRELYIKHHSMIDEPTPHQPVPAAPLLTLSLSELEAADRILRGGKQPSTDEAEQALSGNLEELAKEVNPLPPCEICNGHCTE